MYTIFAMYGTIGIIVFLAFIWYVFGGTLKRTVQTGERVADKGLHMLDDLTTDQAFKVRLTTSKSVVDTATELYSLQINMTPAEMWEAYQMSQADLMSNAQGKQLTPVERKRFIKASFNTLMQQRLAQQVQTPVQPQSQPQPSQPQANPQSQPQMMAQIRI